MTIQGVDPSLTARLTQKLNSLVRSVSSATGLLVTNPPPNPSLTRTFESEAVSVQFTST